MAARGRQMTGDELTLLIYELVQPEPKSERGELQHRWAAAAARPSGPPHPFVEFTSFRFEVTIHLAHSGNSNEN